MMLGICALGGSIQPKVGGILGQNYNATAAPQLCGFVNLTMLSASYKLRSGYFAQSAINAASNWARPPGSYTWPPDFATSKPSSHIMMVPALSGSELLRSVWRAANVAHGSVVRSIGFLLSGFIFARASSSLSPGLFLHSASRAKPNAANAPPYMT